MGCRETQKPISVNEEIPSQKLKQVDDVLDDFRQSLENSDIESFYDLCQPGTEEINSIYFMEFISEGQSFIEFFLEEDFQKENRYYISSESYKNEIIAYASEGYNFQVPDQLDDGYSRFVYVVEGEYNNFDIVLTVVFSEVDQGFKIERFTLGDIRPYGQSVLSLIDKAEKLEDEGYLISAWQFNELASEFLSPSPFIYFNGETRIINNMNRLSETLSEEVLLPMDVELEEGVHLKLYAIDSNKYKDGFYCRIVYVSNLPERQASETFIREEAKNLHKRVMELLPGLGQGFEDKILYTAYFEAPVEQGKNYKNITVNIKE